MHHEIVRCNVAANSLQFATPDKEIHPRLIAPREKYIRKFLQERRISLQFA